MEKYNNQSFCFYFYFCFLGCLFFCFACLLLPYRLPSSISQSGLTSSQMEAQLSSWNFLLISSCLFLLPHFSVGSLFPGPHILVYMSPPFGGEHLPKGLSARVNGRHILKPQIPENIIGATLKNI